MFTINSSRKYREQEGAFCSEYRVGERDNVLPSRPDECGLCIVRRIPCADTKLDPSFSVHGQVDLPEPPSMIVLLCKILQGDLIPDMASTRGQVSVSSNER